MITEDYMVLASEVLPGDEILAVAMNNERFPRVKQVLSAQGRVAIKVDFDNDLNLAENHLVVVSRQVRDELLEANKPEESYDDQG